jgi:hypothetical protein
MDAVDPRHLIDGFEQLKATSPDSPDSRSRRALALPSLRIAFEARAERLSRAAG